MQRYDIGRVFGRAFAVIRSGMGSVGLFLLAIAALTQGVQQAMWWLMGQEIERARLADHPDLIGTGLIDTPLYWLSILAATVLATVGTAGSLAGYARLAGGKPAGIDACINQGIARFLPVFALTLLWWLGVVFGFLVFIVPGVILIVIWSAALPALVVERNGVFEAFGRSRTLTRGWRGIVFVTLLVLALLLYVPPAIFGASVLGGLDQIALNPGFGNNIALIVGSTLYGWYSAMVLNAVLVAIHQELVEVNEGGSTGELSEVFG